MKKITFTYVMAGLLIISSSGFGQTSLEKYIDQGIRNNLVLQQKAVEIEKAEYALRTAGSLFFPSVTLLADYTTGEGGRQLDIPVGDMLNPVYSTLNQLTRSNSFPQISNVSQDFLPKNQYDVRLRTSMPLINTDLIFNNQIQGNKKKISELELLRYKRDLVKQIKTAYYNFLSASEVEKIYQSALVLATQAKRVHESMLEHGSGIPVYILRAESEIAGLNAKIAEARGNKANASRYFNFLINRSLGELIETDSVSGQNELLIQQAKAGMSKVEEREEIRQLLLANQINQSLVALQQYSWLPKVNTFIDLGAQDKTNSFRHESRYYIFGLQLSMPVFDMFRTGNRIAEAKLDLQLNEIQSSLVQNQLQLSTMAAAENVRSALQKETSAQAQLKAAQHYHQLITKGYQAGQHTYIETIDARNQLTQAELQLNLSKYQLLSALSEYERETIAINNTK